MSELTVNLEEVVAELNVILSRIQDPVPFFDKVGDEQRTAIQRRLTATKTDPDGDAWKPWAPFTYNKRHLKGNVSLGILWDEGRLLDSIHSEVDGAFGVDIGTDIWYAPLQQDGDGKIPSREFIGWEADMIPRLATQFVMHLEGAKI